MSGRDLPFAASVPFRLVVKVWLVGLTAALMLLVGEAPASTLARQDVTIPMDDGVSIAASLYIPDGAAPSGGWPAIVFLHGFGRDRSDSNALVEGYGFVDHGYAILTYDARGHGSSTGLVSVAGPREVADARAVHDWLDARPDVADTKIAALGISYGGGTIFNSLVAGVPWAAVVTVETWTDLYAGLMPQGLVKSGLVVALSSSIPEARRDPALASVQAAAFAGTASAVRPWAAQRSSLSKLSSVTTPVFMAQGRRDFLFGIDQATQALQRLRGPKLLYLGLHGHAPSTFPASDTGALMAQVRSWFDCHLRGGACGRVTGVALAREGSTEAAPWGASLPRTTRTTFALPGVTTFAQRGKAVRTTAPLRKAIEVFGSPTVRLSAAASGGWSRLVAVLTARTPQGREIVVSAGGVPTKNGARKVEIRLVSQATFVPRGSRLTLTLASASTAQSSSNLLYLDLPMAASARVRVGTAVLELPVLRTPVTK
jgi:predicted acyl esterase